jgi:hypothetical protein
MQTLMSENIGNMLKWAAFVQHINQQIGHFIILDSVIGFHAS